MLHPCHRLCFKGCKDPCMHCRDPEPQPMPCSKYKMELDMQAGKSRPPSKRFFFVYYQYTNRITYVVKKVHKSNHANSVPGCEPNARVIFEFQDGTRLDYIVSILPQVIPSLFRVACSYFDLSFSTLVVTQHGER